MRTPANNPIGTAAQSAVKAQFELLGWGVAPNHEHDLGTDHWVMARDDARVDIRRLVGVQVKAARRRSSRPAIELLGRLASEIPRMVSERLRDPLEVQASRAPHDHEMRTLSSPADPRGPARLTLALLFPDEVTNEDLLALLRGEPAQRAAAVGIAAHSAQPHYLALFAALSKDEDTAVRAAVARGLAIWAGRTGAPPAVAELLDQVLSEPRVRLGLAASETLSTDESHAIMEPLLRRLSRHPSAVVRWRANHALSRMGR